MLLRRLIGGAILILFVAGNCAADDRKKSEEKDENFLNDDVSDNVVLLNDEGEIRNDLLDNEYSTKLEEPEFDLSNNNEESSQQSEVFLFDEFIPERQKLEVYDPKAEALYNSALEILSKKRWSDVVQNDIRNAYMDLEEAARLKHLDAEKILAFFYLFGDYRWSIDEAKKIFEKLAERGSPDGHLGLGFLYSTGIGVGEPNLARGFLHYTFSALGGNPLAQMALGYRFGYGVSATQSCESSLMWYKKVAEKVASKVKLTGSASIQRIRIPDEIESMPGSLGTLLDNNVFSYYKYLAETGDMQAILGLAQLYLTGSKGVPLDLHSAAKYFKIAAEAGNVQAYAYLGKMYLEGTSATEQNNATAFQYFKKAADKGNAIGQNGLGMMFLYGYGVKADPYKALKLFMLAAEQGLSDAQLHLGQIYFQGLGVRRDYKQALKYFQLASQSGHILAVYNLAQMHAKGLGVLRNCRFAMALYKNVAERGRWAERFMDAYMKFQNGAVDEAAFRYLFLAEFGYETAQTNFAYLMDQQKTQLFGEHEAYKRALLSWQRAANQDYAIARVKLGDYKYYGLGTEVDFNEAANHYKIAVTSHQNPQAMFNLGYMHEHGLGVNKDLHLAKRYYDLAAETSTEAFVPVTLALTKLRIEFLLDYFFAGVVLRSPSMSMLDAVLGPDWDLYLMSLLFGLLVWLIYCYFRNTQRNHNNNQ